MFYLGIDQHARQLTVSLRGEDGDVLLARQVSTEPGRIQAFFTQFTRDRLPVTGGFVAVVQVCGFSDCLIRMLRHHDCARVILIRPEDRKKRNTDRRDAAALSELLWANRERLLHGKPVRGLRPVEITDPADQENRRLTTLRKEAGVARARLINKVKWVLHRHNLQRDMPTKTFPTAKAVAWLKGLALPAVDRLEADHLLADLAQADRRLKDLE
jgi:transposase